MQRYKEIYMKNHPLYTRYSGMLSRCYNPNTDSYPHYGARGIKVCDRWRNNFWDYVDDLYDMGYDSSIPGSQISLDRIDNDGDYSPENCRLVSPYIQANNRSNSVHLTNPLTGETHTVAEWARICGISYASMYERYEKYKSGIYNIDDTFKIGNKKTESLKLITYNGRTQKVSDWSKETGIPAVTIRYRIRQGYSPEAILSESLVEKPVTIGQFSLPMMQWDKIMGYVNCTVSRRIRDGMDPTQAVLMPTPNNMKLGMIIQRDDGSFVTYNDMLEECKSYSSDNN